jgi:prevent-host-death family protein
MIEVTATDMAREFSSLLGKVEQGETVIVRKHGKPVARLVPDSVFMSGRKAADLFRSHKADKLDRQAADAIEAQIRKLDREAEDALAH